MLTWMSPYPAHIIIKLHDRMLTGISSSCTALLHKKLLIEVGVPSSPVPQSACE